MLKWYWCYSNLPIAKYSIHSNDDSILLINEFLERFNLKNTPKNWAEIERLLK